ncbi:MAG: guanylate kinase [Bacteroidales bacterium]|nr:guanylate kinase [Bacteroidales bacterium]
MNKVVIISAPSGAGKTTLVQYILEKFPQMEFSISATSRKPRPNEMEGKDYYFITQEEFKKRIENNEFVEWEEVYPGCFYGTLRSELERIWNKGKIVLFDVDVKGGINLKRIFKDNALSVFISPPNIEVLAERLKKRGTETEESLKTRIEKAVYEMTFQTQFDEVVINDDLKQAQYKITEIINNWLMQNK